MLKTPMDGKSIFSSDSNISAAINGYWTGANGGVISEDITNVDGLNTYQWSPPNSLANQDSVRIRILSKENIVLDPKTKEVYCHNDHWNVLNVFL